MGLFTEYTENQMQSDAVLSCKVNPMQLEWEPTKYGGHMTFIQSLERLRKAGYKRHPRPYEVFSLLCDHFEGNLDTHLDAVAKDMLYVGNGEWLSMAVECKGNSLVCYTDPENLISEGKKWIVDGPYLKCSDKQVFDISGIPLHTWVDIEKFSPEFVEAIYSQDLASLLKLTRAVHRRNPQVFLVEGGIRTIGRRRELDIDNCSDRASRGVR